MENNNIANHVNIFACVRFKRLRPFNCVLFKRYKFMKGRTGSTMSRTKYVKYFRVETSCYRVVLQKFIVTVKLLYNPAESDYVHVKLKCGPLPPGSAVNLNKLNRNGNRVVHQNALWSLVFCTTRP